MQGLTIFDSSVGHLENEGYEQIASCLNLRRLEIQYANFTEERAKLISDSLVNLTSLKIDFCYEGMSDSEKGKEEAALLIINNLNLSELGLANFALTDGFISLMVENLPDLTYLDISNSLITSTSFAELAKLPKLTELKLTGIKIKPQEMHLIANCKNLQSLALSSDQLDVDHLEKTEFFKSLSKLEKLEINTLAVDPDEAEMERRYDRSDRTRNFESLIDKKLRKLMRSYPRIDVSFKYGRELNSWRTVTFRNDRLGINTKNDR